MAGLKEVRVRIGSVRSTRKITSAMKMVSAAKFHRAQGRHSHYQLFFQQFQHVMGLSLARGAQLEHPLMRVQNAEAPELVLIFTSNGSMCGGYNNALAQRVRESLLGAYSNEEGYALWAYGRKGADLLRRGGVHIARSDEKLVENPDYMATMSLYDELQAAFELGQYSRVVLAYNQFKTAASQTPVMRQLLPIEMPEIAEDRGSQEYIFEPAVSDFFAYALPSYARLMLYGAVLDNAIGEHGARMTAMTQATDNADTLLEDLTLEYNKARQSAITNELVEIVSGASALNG